MSENDRYSGTQVLLAFLAGAAAGAVVALLTAPSSGKEARGKVRDWARDLESKAAEVPTNLRAAYGKAADAAKSAFSKGTPEDERGT